MQFPGLPDGGYGGRGQGLVSGGFEGGVKFLLCVF